MPEGEESHGAEQGCGRSPNLLEARRPFIDDESNVCPLLLLVCETNPQRETSDATAAHGYLQRSRRGGRVFAIPTVRGRSAVLRKGRRRRSRGNRTPALTLLRLEAIRWVVKVARTRARDTRGHGCVKDMLEGRNEKRERE